MFDFAFSELALIGVVALVVIGPERLPRVARTAGVVVGRLQRYAATVRADIEREVELSELRRVQTDLQQAARSLESGVRDSLASAETHFEGVRETLSGTVAIPAQGSAADQVSDHAAQPEGTPVAGVHPAPLMMPLASVAAPPPAPVEQASLFTPAETPPGESAHPQPDPQ